MSKSVAYSVLVRDGQKRCFEDRWAVLYRELMWGPEAYEAWLDEGEEIDWEPEELSGIAVVDFDQKQLRWGETEAPLHPRVFAVHQRILQQAWPGFDISFLCEREMYAEVHGPSDDDDDDQYDERPETVKESAESFADEVGDDEDELEGPYEEESPCAWATIIDQKGRVRHRAVSQISVDLLSGVKSAVQELAKVKAAEVPPENCVKEGFWIHLGSKEIGYWGGAECRSAFERLQKTWPKWKVKWVEDGYARQCEVGNQPGIPMTDTDALVKFVPHILSTTQFDMSHMMSAMGGSLKRTALKGAGCLTVVLILPILLAGFFMDKLSEAGYAAAVVVLIVAVVFKVLESKVRNKFKGNPLSQQEKRTNHDLQLQGHSTIQNASRSLIDFLPHVDFHPLRNLSRTCLIPGCRDL